MTEITTTEAVRIQRVESNSSLVYVHERDAQATVWRGEDGRWIITINGVDVCSRAKRDAAETLAVRILCAGVGILGDVVVGTQVDGSYVTAHATVSVKANHAVEGLELPSEPIANPAAYTNSAPAAATVPAPSARRVVVAIEPAGGDESAVEISLVDLPEHLRRSGIPSDTMAMLSACNGLREIFEITSDRTTVRVSPVGYGECPVCLRGDATTLYPTEYSDALDKDLPPFTAHVCAACHREHVGHANEAHRIITLPAAPATVTPVMEMDADAIDREHIVIDNVSAHNLIQILFIGLSFAPETDATVKAWAILGDVVEGRPVRAHDVVAAVCHAYATADLRSDDSAVLENRLRIAYAWAWSCMTDGRAHDRSIVTMGPDAVACMA